MKLKQIVIADLTELVLPKTCQTDFPDPDDTLNFKLIISPDEVRKTFQLRSLVIKEHFPGLSSSKHIQADNSCKLITIKNSKGNEIYLTGSFLQIRSILIC